MNIAWSATSFGYYLISYYLKYIPGDIYTNVILASISEIFSSFFSATLCNHPLIGAQKSLLISFLISGFFSFLLVITTEDVSSTPKNGDDPVSFYLLLLVILIKLGLSSAQNVCSLITAELFPIAYSSSVFGFCNIAARFTTILAPLVAEMPTPMPMLIFSAVQMGSVFFIERLKKS
jgi:hypothetical protein